MGARILDGTMLAKDIRQQVRSQIDDMARAGHRLKLAAVLVGSPPAGLVYANSQQVQCERMGLEYELHQLPGDADEAVIADRIDRLNTDASVTGIMLHMPL